MLREEAIYYLQSSGFSEEQIRTIEQAFTCEDAISREDALMCLTGEWTEITDEIIHRFIKRIKALPPVNPSLEEREEGRWIIEREEETGKVKSFHCSKCYEKTRHFETIASNFCPECGAKMNLYPIEEWECIKDGDTE